MTWVAPLTDNDVRSREFVDAESLREYETELEDRRLAYGPPLAWAASNRGVER